MWKNVTTTLLMPMGHGNRASGACMVGRVQSPAASTPGRNPEVCSSSVNNNCLKMIDAPRVAKGLYYFYLWSYVPMARYPGCLS